MKEKITVDELRSFYNAFKEKAEILDEIKGIKGINEILNEIKDILSDLRDENSYKNNYLMVRLKKETSIGYQAIEKLINMGAIIYEKNHFDFRCTFKGVIGAFFSYIGFTESKVLSEYVTHKGKPVEPITFINANKNAEPIKEWPIIKNIINNLNLTKK
jgi:hypothetical protein